jgi:hypothetical protein
MEWCSWPLVVLRGVLCPWSQRRRGKNVKEKEKGMSGFRHRKPRKVPFYSQIPTTQIRLYQSYIDRAFLLSPTLEFEKNDPRFTQLLAEAAAADSLSVIDLELMRMQFVLADRGARDEYRPSWAVKVINRKDNDFFPSPWAVVSALFAKDKQVMPCRH